MTPTLRIANALGDVGHLSLASSGQNLLFLWVLQKVVSPGVQSFCTFAAVALIFDFFFHLMFFVAVLNVDVRRMELQDSIDRTKLHSKLKQRSRVQRTYWFDALVQGKTPIITRIAGSAVSICFILFLNVHFSDSDSVGRMFLRFIMGPFARSNNSRQDTSRSLIFTSSPINSPRTPQTWLKLQDHQSAREVIKYIKPQAHILVARIYEPLVLVFRGADRTQIPLRESSLRLLLTSAQNHVYPLLLGLISMVGIVTLLMQYLLWNEIPPDEEETPSVKLNVKRIPAAHNLDIFQVATNQRGHILALDLDRGVVLYSLDDSQQLHKPKLIHDGSGNSAFMSNPMVCLDESGGWIGIWDAAGSVDIWNVQDMEIVSSIAIKAEPLLLTFASNGFEEPQLLVLASTGTLRRFGIRDGAELDTFQVISKGNLKHAIASKVNGLCCITAISSNGEIYVRLVFLGDKEMPSPSSESSASSESQRLLHETDPRLTSIMTLDKAQSLSHCSSLSLIAVRRLRVLDLVHFDTGLLIHRVELPREHVPVSNVRLVHTVVQSCRLCHHPAVFSLNIAYTTRDSRYCVIKSYARTDEAEPDSDIRPMICLRPTSNEIKAGTCKGLAAAGTHTTIIDNDSGRWDATRLQTFIGVRRKRRLDDESLVDLASIKKMKSHSTSISLASNTPLSLAISSSSLRSRQGSRDKKEDAVTWEIWAFDSISGAMTVEKLNSASDTGGGYAVQDLLVAEPGPVVSLGKRSVIIAMGASLRTVTVGSDRIELNDSEIIRAAKRTGSASSMLSLPVESRRRVRGPKV
jgi:hypothetical protein